MDENLKNKFRQYSSTKKYPPKKGKVSYKYGNSPDMEKNDKNNDTKVFVFTPDMLKKLGVNLNSQQLIEKPASFVAKDIDNQTDVKSKNVIDDRLLLNDSLNKKTVSPHLKNNKKSNDESNILTNDLVLTNSQIDNFSFDLNEPGKSNYLRVKNIYNTSIESDFIIPDMLPPSTPYELYATPYDAVNSNENIDSSIVYSESMTSNDQAENINYDNECTFLNEIQDVENNAYVQSPFDSFEHLNMSHSENDESTNIIPNECDFLVDSNSTNNILKSISKRKDQMDARPDNDFTDNITTLLHEQDQIVMESYKFNSNPSSHLSNKVKTYQSKSPKFSTNKLNSNKSDHQHQKHVQTDIHFENNLVGNNEKSINTENVEGDKKNMDEIVLYLRKFLQKSRENVQNSNKSDLNKTDELICVEENVDSTSTTNNNSITKPNTNDVNTQQFQDNHEIRNHVEVISIENDISNENIHEPLSIPSPENCNKRICSDISKDSECSTLNNVFIEESVNSPGEASLHELETKELNLSDEEQLSECSSNGCENLAVDNFLEPHREKEIGVSDLIEYDNSTIINPDQSLENSNNTTEESKQPAILKNKEQTKNNIDFNEFENSEIINVDQPPDKSNYTIQKTKPKKRGRKKKIIDGNESEKIESIDPNKSLENSNDTTQESKDLPLPKKRERKKKIIDFYESDNSESIYPDESNENFNDTSRESNQPKKKGRKKRTIESEKIKKPRKAKKLGKNKETPQPADELDSTIESQQLDDTMDCDSETSANISINTVSKILEISKKGKVNTSKGLKRPVTYYKKSFVNFDLPKMMCKCAVCGNEMLLRDFPAHSLDVHNLLSWTEGENPIDLTDIRLVKRLLSIKLKVNKKLVCENCGLSRSSADGFISHIMACEKSEDEIAKLMVECPVCFKSMLPISLKFHMTIHKPGKANGLHKTEAVEENLDTNRKRKAATQALESFKKLKTENDINESLSSIKTSKNLYVKPINNKVHPMIKKAWKSQEEKGLPLKCSRCDYSTLSLVEVENHFKKKCPLLQKLTKNFQCLNCDKACRYEDDMIKHIWDNHKDFIPESKIIDEPDKEVYGASSEESVESEEEDYISEPETEMGKPNYSAHHIYTDKSLNKESIMEILFSFTYEIRKREAAFHQKYAENFISHNYSTVALCKDIHYNDFLPLSNTAAENFLPEIQHSCSISHSVHKRANKNFQWKKYKLFESEIFKGSATMWCGGPVWALGWVPGERENKYLAVAADFDGKIKNAHDIYNHNNIIQFWNAGKLHNDSGGCSVPPEMVFAIAHDYGVIWDMDWCPSGCSDDCYIDIDQHKRDSNSIVKMGLLAIACSNGKSYIYVIPHPSFLTESETKLYETKPSIELHFNNPNSNECNGLISQACKIKWSQYKGHKVVMVGYSNGFVALFDLTTQSSLLKTDMSNTIILSPFEKFQPYTEPITGLTFVPQYEEDAEEENIVIGVSSSMGYSMWSNFKLIFKQKGRFTNLTNLNPWPQVIAIPEEISHPNFGKSSYTCSRVVAGTLAGCSEATIASAHMFQGGGALDSSLWHNKIVVGGASGIIGIYPEKTPFIRIHQIKKKIIEGVIVSFSKEVLIDTSNEQSNSDNPASENNSISQEEKSKSYGLVFVDIPKKPNYHKMIKGWNVKFDKLIHQPLTKLNCIKTHPSSTSHYFNACGGSAGQVRILFTNLVDHFHKR